MVEKEERKFRARRVIGLEPDADRDEAAPPVPEPQRPTAEPGSDPRDDRRPPNRDYAHLDAERATGLGGAGRFGVAVAATSFLLLILVYALPWLVQDGSALGRADARQGPLDANVSYLGRLTTMPVWGLAFSGVAGLGLLAADHRARTVGQHALVAVPASCLGVYGTFLVLLAVARIFGYWFAQLLDAEAAAFHPHVVPWLLGGAGGVLGLVFVGRLRAAWAPIAEIPTDAWASRAATWSKRTIYVAAGALLALPLLPLASDFGADPSHVNEAGFFAGAGPFPFLGESVENAAGALELIHLMLWLTIGVSGFVLVVGAVERLGWIDLQVRDPLLQGFLLNVVFWLVLLVTVALLYTTHIPNVQFSFVGGEDYAPALNHVLPAALLLLGWTIGRYVLRVTVPYARGLASEPSASDVSLNDGS